DDRVNSAFPFNERSSVAICRPTVGCVSPSERLAADRLPVRRPSRNERYRSHPGPGRLMHLCIACVRSYAIPFTEPGAKTGSHGIHHAGVRHMKSQTALILGITGGIGGEVARVLVQRGWKVKALHRNPSTLNLPDELHGHVEIVQGDAMRQSDVIAA